MSAEHTPGPWMQKPASINPQTGEPFHYYIFDATGEFVCGTWGKAHVGNANLIAAAPELAQALAEALSALNLRFDHTIQKGTAALLKAGVWPND